MLVHLHGGLITHWPTASDSAVSHAHIVFSHFPPSPEKTEYNKQQLCRIAYTGMIATM